MVVGHGHGIRSSMPMARSTPIVFTHQTGHSNAYAGTFHNVTIEETCNVKGTVYANKIVGDVLSAKVVGANSTDSAGSGHVVASASVKGARTHAANLYCLGVTVEVYASGGYRPGGNDQDVPATISGRLVLTDSFGVIFATAPFKVRSGSNSAAAAASQSITIQGGFNAGTGSSSISCVVIIDSQSASYGGSAGVRVPAQSVATDESCHSPNRQVGWRASPSDENSQRLPSKAGVFVCAW